MAKEVNLGAEIWFQGCDHNYIAHIKNQNESLSIDITGWGLSFMVKRRKTDAVALITKTTAGGGIVIAGTFTSNPATNLQRATAGVSDDDTLALEPGLLFFEWKRTDAGFETVLVEGSVLLERALHP